MIDIQRLSALHAATTQGAWHQCGANNGKCPCGLVWTGEADTVVARCKSVDDGLPRLSDEQVRANGDFIAEAHNAWPAVAAELTMLREFARRVRVSCRFRDDISVAGSVIDDIDWLDAETKKAGE